MKCGIPRKFQLYSGAIVSHEHEKVNQNIIQGHSLHINGENRRLTEHALFA